MLVDLSNTGDDWACTFSFGLKWRVLTTRLFQKKMVTGWFCPETGQSFSRIQIPRMSNQGKLHCKWYANYRKKIKKLFDEWLWLFRKTEVIDDSSSVMRPLTPPTEDDEKTMYTKTEAVFQPIVSYSDRVQTFFQRMSTQSQEPGEIICCTVFLYSWFSQSEYFLWPSNNDEIKPGETNTKQKKIAASRR